MRKYMFMIVACSCLYTASCTRGVKNWHAEMIDSGGGYWQTRAAVEVENPSDKPVEGGGVRLVVGGGAGQLPLEGSTTRSLRVVNADGLEYLYRIEASDEKRGVLSSGDALLFAVDVPAKNKATYFIYADNADANAVTEFLDDIPVRSEYVDGRQRPVKTKTVVAEGLRVRVRAPERLKIEARMGSDEWNPPAAGDWRVRALIRTVFLSPPGDGDALVIAYVARPVHMLRRLAGGSLSAAQARVIDAESKTELPSVWAGERIFFNARVSRPSQQRFFVYFSPSGGTQAATEEVYQRFLKSAANLVPRAPGEAKPAPIAVSPNAKYVYAGWLRTEGLVQEGFPTQTDTFSGTGTLDLRGRFFTSEGKPMKNPKERFFDALRSVTGTTPRTLHVAMVETPLECAKFEVTLSQDSHATIDSIFLARATEGVVTATRAADSEAARAAVAVWPVNPMVKVFPDDPPLPSGSIAISLARNEWEPAQVALRSQTELKNVRVTFPSVRNASGAELPVHAYKVASVPVDRSTAYYQTYVPAWCRKAPKGPGYYVATEGWAGEWPDPLPPLKPFDLQPGRTQPLWFEIYAPENAAAGDYAGTVRIEADGMAAQEIPFKATVWAFTLPRARHLKVAYSLSSGPGWDVTEGDNPEVLRKWYKVFAEHRMSPNAISPPPKFTYEDGQVRMDATAFDKMAHIYFDETGMNHAYTPRILYAFGWANQLRPLFGLQPHTPEYDKAYQAAYRLFLDHVTKFGWRNKIVHYISDEPFLDDDRVVADLRYIIGLSKAVAPDVPIYSSTWHHSDKLDGYLTMWGPGQQGMFSMDKLAERLKAGDKALFTTDSQQALDTPYLGTERLLPIYCYKYGTAGYEFWGATWWTLNPWDRGWHSYIPQTDNGKDYYYIRYPDGDGYMFYPGDRVGVDEPVASLRAKGVREGAEDYEYYLLLDEAIKVAQQRGMDVSAASSALDGARAQVSIPNAGGIRSTEIMPDPDAIYRVRRQVAEQILRLRKP
jgi:hypothetical protein